MEVPPQADISIIELADDMVALVVVEIVGPKAAARMVKTLVEFTQPPPVQAQA